MKNCKKCGEVKPTTEFSKAASKPDGLQCYCKSCARLVQAKWQTANAGKVRAYSEKWVAANPDKAIAGRAKWRTSNPDKAKTASANWRVANMDKHREYTAKWYAANPDAGRIHRQNRSARKREAGGRLSAGLAAKLFKLQRGKCACGCGQPLGDDYHLDHRMPLALGGANEDWNMQLLTATCNLQKSTKHPVEFMQQRGFLL